MSLGSLLNTLSSEGPTLDDVWRWYEFQRAIVGEEKGRVFEEVGLGIALTQPRYFGKTIEELEADFAYHLAELGHAVALLILASTEAALRVDFVKRVGQKKKDPVSRRFRQVHKRRKDRCRLEEDILDVWVDQSSESGVKAAVSEFKGALNYRHWLAHGRYWKPKLGYAAGYEPVDVLEICRKLLEVTALKQP
jgi:hypothetical protein